MTYIALSRRWRPQTFSDLLGQDHITRTLTNALTAGRIHHAYLFAGSRGVGKTSLARILAKSLNCEQGPSPAPCGACTSCREIAGTSSMDVIEIDGASNTGVENIRELREHVSYLPARGRYKVYIIDEVHMLSTAAFNALLKTLEEPPPHVIFIFATTEPHKIPETILSRCQRFDFALLPAPLIIERLRTITEKEKIRAGPGSLELITREAGGSLRDAESILDQVLAYRPGEIREEDIQNILGIVDRTTISHLMEAITLRQPERALKIIDEIHRLGFDLSKFSTQILERFRDLLVVSILPPADLRSETRDHPLRTPDELAHLSPEEITDLTRLRESLELERTEAIIRILLSALEEMGRSPSRRTVLELALIRAARTQRILPLDQILSRLESLEKRLREGNPEPSPSENPPRPSPRKTRERETPPAAPGTAAPPEEWSAFLSSLQESRPMLANVMEACGFIEITEKEARFSLPDNPLSAAQARDPENLETLSALAAGFLGRAVRLVPVESRGDDRPRTSVKRKSPEENAAVSKSSPGPSARTPEPNRESPSETDLDRHRKAETRDNPLVKEALDILGGELKEIRIRKRPI